MNPRKKCRCGTRRAGSRGGYRGDRGDRGEGRGPRRDYGGPARGGYRGGEARSEGATPPIAGSRFEKREAPWKRNEESAAEQTRPRRSLHRRPQAPLEERFKAGRRSAAASEGFDMGAASAAFKKEEPYGKKFAKPVAGTPGAQGGYGKFKKASRWGAAEH